MARRADGGVNRGRVWRAVAVGVTLAATGACALGGTIAHADEPPVVPDASVPTGEIDGAIVAVGMPPVPPTTIEVAVGEPPVPPTSIEVAVGEPPVPPVTIPDAVPPVDGSGTEPTLPARSALPETGSSTATAIVAGAAASVGDVLWALARSV